METSKACIIAVLLAWGLSVSTVAKNYYVGTFAKLDSKICPISSEDIRKLSLMGGDTLFLSADFPLKGSISLKNVFPKNNPVVITSYGSTPALIDAAGEGEGIWLENCGNIVVKNIAITASGRGGKEKQADGAFDKKMRCGILVEITDAGDFSDIHLKDITISDVFFEEPGFVRDVAEVRTANGTQAYGWGIRFINARTDASLSKISVSNCKIHNVSHTGIKFSGKQENIRDIEVSESKVTYAGGPGMQMSGVLSAHVHHNLIDHSGAEDDSRKWGRGSGYWCWGARDIVLEHNYLLNANGPGDSSGAHIDYNCSDIIYQYNFSYNNAGGFCEILGNNHNCVYRYNISVNDGWREKDKKGAFHEGKVLWLSGYIGSKKRHGPYNSYVYNNTICVTNYEDIRVAIGNTTDGLLLANNIFYFKSSRPVLGDQFNPEKKQNGLRAKNVIFKNNLFLSENNWDKMIPIQAVDSFFGDPDFENLKGTKPADFTPKKELLIKNKGIVIPTLLNDSIGIRKGINVSHDILGNQIKGNPDIGAIEL